MMRSPRKTSKLFRGKDSPRRVRVLKEGMEISRCDQAKGSAANQNGGPPKGYLDHPFMTPGSCTVDQFVFLVLNKLVIPMKTTPESQRVDCSDADASRVQEL
jgi:hypothetical protein